MTIQEAIETTDKFRAELGDSVLLEALKVLVAIANDAQTMLHQRKCRTCGNVAWHADCVIPYVLCRKCGSQDTRKVTS